MNKSRHVPSDICRFEESLINHQEDLRRIIGKYRNKYSSLTIEDVISTINFQLLKTKDKFFEKFGYEFTKADFGKWAYAFARNNCTWDESRDFKKSHHLKDGVFSTDEGEKTLFELVCDTVGEENEDLEEFDKGAKVKVIENMIRKYSHILTDAEKTIFGGLLEGKSENDLSTAHGVTHQAINISKRRIYEKIQAAYKVSIEDCAAIPFDEITVHIEMIEWMCNRIEKRRMKDPRITKHVNRAPYKYFPH